MTSKLLPVAISARKISNSSRLIQRMALSTRRVSVVPHLTQSTPMAPLFEELFDSMSRGSAALRDSSLPMLSTMNSLANPLSVDFYESEDMYHLDADLPGVKKEDLKIECNDEHVITIEAKKIQDECSVEDDDGNVKDGRIYHRMERSIVGRSLRRSLRLPQDAIIDNLKAKFQDGVLHIHMPKVKELEKSESKVVEIE